MAVLSNWLPFNNVSNTENIKGICERWPKCDTSCPEHVPDRPIVRVHTQPD